MMINRIEIPSTIYRLVSVVFGAIAFLIGMINIFWGNDPGFGIFIVLLSILYIPRANAIAKEKIGRTIPAVLKILIALFILWSALGVGELFDKIELMVEDLSKVSD
jgi:hypothetical protein